MAQDIYQHTFANGLTLLAERMEHVGSAALNFLVPAGCAFDPPEHLGIGSVLAGLITRGAGKRNSRELSLALDNLGLDRDESVGSIHIRFWGATLARNLSRALEIYSDILRRPHLPEAELDAVQSLAFQDLQGLEDEPRQKVLVELRRCHYPPPLGHDRRGSLEGIQSLTADAIRQHYQRLFHPKGVILSGPATSNGNLSAIRSNNCLAIGRGVKSWSCGWGLTRRRIVTLPRTPCRHKSPWPLRACRSAIPTITRPWAQ